jgi:hypothetical protein
MTPVREVVDRIVALGIVDERTVAEKLDPHDLGQTLDYFGEPDEDGVRYLLDDLGIRYTTDYKTFRGACEDGASLYREELELAAACARGLLTVTDVALVDDARGDHLLRFRCNGQPHEWHITHGEHEDFEAGLTFATWLCDLLPAGSSRRWCTIEPPDPDVGSEFVFGDPAALNRLGAEYGLTFEPTP